MGARTRGDTGDKPSIGRPPESKGKKTSFRLVITVGYTTPGIRQYNWYTRVFVATPTSHNSHYYPTIAQTTARTILNKNISPSILDLLDITLLLVAASQAGPIVGIPLDGVDILLGSTCLEGSLASFKVASMVLRTEEGEDEDVRGDDTNKNTLNEGVVGYDLGAGRGLDGSLVLVTTSYGREKEG